MMKPATVALSAAPRPCTVDTAPCATLNRPDPRVRSAITMGNNAPKMPAPTPSSAWTASSQTALSDTV